MSGAAGNRAPVATGSGHSAAAPALGYATQIEHGLLTLLDLAFHEPASMTLEVFDDIETLTGRERTYTQIKNKPGSTRQLTDSSPDVWSTLDNWRDAWLQRSTQETQRFCLVTTQTVAQDSALAVLRPGLEYSPEQAAIRLESVARDSKNQGTADERKRYLELDQDQREALLRCVEVCDNAADDSAIEGQMLANAKLRAATDAANVASLVTHLRGWWAQRSLAHLHNNIAGGADRITVAELEEQIQDGRRQHARNALPVYETLDPEDLRVESDNDMYLQQLRLIDAPLHRRESARLNYQRAYAHRSLWARRGLITDVELERFESALVEEWQLHRADLDETPCKSETEEKERGMTLLTRAELHVRLPLRADLHQPFVQRGTYHSLSDRLRLGWHPRWEDLVPAATSEAGEDAP